MRIETKLRLGVGLGTFLAMVLVAGTAEAQIYKYKKADGTIVYTDNLSDLPKEKRAQYNKMLAEQRKKAQELEKRLGKEEADRRRAEAEKKRMEEEKAGAEQKQAAIARLEESIKAYRKKNEERNKARDMWKKRYKDAKAALAKKLEEFRQAQKDYSALAMKADFALLPGESKKKQDLLKRLGELEKEIDALAHELNVVIPEEARRAGVPPGWVRD